MMDVTGVNEDDNHEPNSHAKLTEVAVSVLPPQHSTHHAH